MANPVKISRGQLNKKLLVVIAGMGVIIFLLGFVIGYFAVPNDGESADSCNTTIGSRRRADIQRKGPYHSKLYKGLNADEIGKNLKYFSERPHLPGTQRSKALADEIAKRWREYKFDKIEMPKYNVLLPYVNPNITNRVQIVDIGNNTVVREFSGKEKLADPSEEDDTMIPPFLGYSKQGSVSGKLLYVNYGRAKDFGVLKNNFSIPNCNGHIAIMRYGNIFLGDQVKNARKCGAIGAILYSDPADFAREGQDKVYPNYIWLPKTGVYRGSLVSGHGDPLTPGLPSVDGVFRIPLEQVGLPQIPATPMSYGDAVKILKIMKGLEVPDSWKGTLPITYRLGNEGLQANTTVRIEVNFPNTKQDIYNVIGTIYGKEEPDRWVLIGNHRDAWGFGAVDPSSGTAAMMEISRGLSKLLKDGWRPRRTIKLCSWGAEEAGLIGSTEWVEQNEHALSTKGVTYINVDVAVGGNHIFNLFGSPMFKTTMIETTKNVEDPHLKSDGKRTTLYERMVEVEGEMAFYSLGSASDYASFYHFVGVPSLDMSYVGEGIYPVYHTVHDTYKWLQGLVDPDFSYHLTTTQVAARALMAIADSIVLPLDVCQYGRTLRKSFVDFNDTYGMELRKNNVTLHYIDTAITRYIKSSAKFQEDVGNAIENKNDIELRNLNDRMVNVEKSFIYDLGLPNQMLYRHVIFTPPFNNDASASFPGISDLMFISNKTEHDWQNIRQQVSVVFKAILAATDTLEAN